MKNNNGLIYAIAIFSLLRQKKKKKKNRERWKRKRKRDVSQY